MEHKVAILRVGGFELAAINRNAHLAEQLQTFTTTKTCLFAGRADIRAWHDKQERGNRAVLRPAPT
jgi:hypothetical protein